MCRSDNPDFYDPELYEKNMSYWNNYFRKVRMILESDDEDDLEIYHDDKDEDY